MKRTLVAAHLSLALMVTIVTSAVAEEGRSFDCSPDAFITQSEDQEFYNANMEKRFLITVDDQQINVSVLSPRFKDHSKVFRVLKKSRSKSYGILTSSVGVDVIAFSEHYFEGAYHATITGQSALDGRVWDLSCQKF